MNRRVVLWIAAAAAASVAAIALSGSTPINYDTINEPAGVGAALSSYGGSVTPDTVLAAFGGSYGDLYLPAGLGYEEADFDTIFDADDGSDFKHMQLDRNAVTANCYDAYGRLNVRSGYSLLSASRMGAVWFDLDKLSDLFPAGSDLEIIEAYVNIHINSNPSLNFTNANKHIEKLLGFYAVLDTMVNDAVAWDSGLSACDYQALAVDASIQYADRSEETPWIAYGSTPFNWSIRTEHYKYGGFSFWGIPSEPAATGTAISDAADVSINVARVLQYYYQYKEVRGLTNAGFWLIPVEDDSGNGLYVDCGSGGAANAGKAPSLIIKARDRANGNNFDWFDKPIVLCYTTDDGYKNYNNAMLDSLAEIDPSATMTAFITEAYISGSPLDTFDIMQAQDMIVNMARGLDIGIHSRTHKYMGSIDPVTQADSLSHECSRQWAVDLLGIAPEDSATVFRTFAWPFGHYSQGAQEVLYNFGYLGARTTTGGVFQPEVLYQYEKGYGASQLSQQDSVTIFALDKTQQAYLIWPAWTAETIADSLALAHVLAPYDAEGAYNANGANVAQIISLAWMMNAPITTLTHNETEWSVARSAAFLRFMYERGDIDIVNFSDTVEHYRENGHSETVWWLWEHD